jgi:enamine deaminase RidA (YjgF/YER057c/UK114 family)
VSPDERLKELGIELPEIPALPFVPRLVPVLEHDGLAYLSGIGPVGVSGTVGADLTLEQGAEAARMTALLALRRIVDAFGELDRVARWVKVLGLVRCTPDFADPPLVVNGFTEQIVEIYGEERGLCARSAIGVNALPAGIPIEVEATLALRP